MPEPDELISALKKQVRPDAEAALSPLVGTLVEKLEEMRSGGSPGTDALLAIQEMQMMQGGAQQHLEATVQGLQFSADQQSLIDQLRQHYAANAALLAELEQSVNLSSLENLRPQIQRLKDLNRAMIECHRRLVAHLRETLGEPSGMVVVPPAFASLYMICDGVARGEVEVAELLNALDAVDSQVRSDRDRWLAKMQGLGEMLTEDAYCNPLSQAISGALENSLQALATMREYAEAREVERLNKGWSALMQSTTVFQESMRTLQAATSTSHTTDTLVLDKDE